jgi:hypothetical protein
MRGWVEVSNDNFERNFEPTFTTPNDVVRP